MKSKKKMQLIPSCQQWILKTILWQARGWEATIALLLSFNLIFRKVSEAPRATGEEVLQAAFPRPGWGDSLPR